MWRVRGLIHEGVGQDARQVLVEQYFDTEAERDEFLATFASEIEPKVEAGLLDPDGLFIANEE